MIAKDDVFVVTFNDRKKNLSNADKELLYWSDIIISDTSLEKNKLISTLQGYKGTYLNAGKPEIVKGILSEKDEVAHIMAIRDAFSEINTNKRGIYYDNAGTYIHLLEDTYTKLQERIHAYNQSQFIILGQNLDNFITDFWLTKYDAGKIFIEWKSENEILSEIISAEKTKKIWIIFVDPDTSKSLLSDIKNKTRMQIYTLPRLEEDTSGWWYIRYVEKMINIFVSAFDTYD